MIRQTAIGLAHAAQKGLGAARTWTIILSMERDALLKLVKCTVSDVEPDAEIILYGSRARGSSTPLSDWDFLILVEGSVGDERVDRIRHRLYEIEWETGQVLCSIVRSRDQWMAPPYRNTPFHRNVELEGIVL